MQTQTGRTKLRAFYFRPTTVLCGARNNGQDEAEDREGTVFKMQERYEQSN